MAMYGRSIVMHSGLWHVTVSVEARVTMAVAAPVGNEYLRVCVVEMTSVIVRVHCECPATCLPGYRTIEVSKAHVLVELPAVQNIAEVCVTAIPPDAEDITVSVQAHQVVEVDPRLTPAPYQGPSNVHGAKFGIN